MSNRKVKRHTNAMIAQRLDEIQGARDMDAFIVSALIANGIPNYPRVNEEDIVIPENLQLPHKYIVVGNCEDGEVAVTMVGDIVVINKKEEDGQEEPESGN